VSLLSKLLSDLFKFCFLLRLQLIVLLCQLLILQKVLANRIGFLRLRVVVGTVYFPLFVLPQLNLIAQNFSRLFDLRQLQIELPSNLFLFFREALLTLIWVCQLLQLQTWWRRLNCLLGGVSSDHFVDLFKDDGTLLLLVLRLVLLLLLARHRLVSFYLVNQTFVARLDRILNCLYVELFVWYWELNFCAILGRCALYIAVFKASIKTFNLRLKCSILRKDSLELSGLGLELLF